MKARLSDLPKDREPMKRYRRRLLERDRDHDRAEIKTESRLTGLPREIKAKRYGRAQTGRNNTENSDRHFLHPNFQVEKLAIRGGWYTSGYLPK